MPYSSEEGKHFILRKIEELNPNSVLDVGTGAGTYAHRIRMLPRGQRIRLMGIEVFAPYVTRYQLDQWYDSIQIGNAVYQNFPPADVVILGDVLEHMIESDAIAVWHKALAVAAKAVILSIPTVHWPQGPQEGNPYEEHLTDWTPAKVQIAFPGITESVIGDQVSVFVADVESGPFELPLPM